MFINPFTAKADQNKTEALEILMSAMEAMFCNERDHDTVYILDYSSVMELCSLWRPLQPISELHGASHVASTSALEVAPSYWLQC